MFIYLTLYILYTKIREISSLFVDFDRAETQEPKYEHVTQLKSKEKALKSYDFRTFLVETIGIEPMTSCMSSKRSNHLGYASVTKY